MILIWLLVIVAIVWFVREFGLLDRSSRGREDRTAPDAHSSEGTRRDPALDALRERYARGEIDDDEFERRKQRLVSNP